MLSRRLLRIKALQEIYAYFQSDDKTINKYEKELFFSIEKAYDLYFYLLQLLIEIADLEEFKIDTNKQKLMPSSEDLNPNTKFIENKIINIIRDNEHFQSGIRNSKINWTDNKDFIKIIYQNLRNSKFFMEYMSIETRSFSEDKKLVIKLFNETILTNDALYEILEEQSIYWNDDVDFIIGMIVKSIKKTEENQTNLKSLFAGKQSKEDENFVKTLFRKTIIEESGRKEIISKYTPNWESDRIAVMDSLIMLMALTEAIEFESIPLKVTLNEYIEISKFYSTEKSSQFINGVLDNLFNDLSKEGTIVKSGRGLA